MVQSEGTPKKYFCSTCDVSIKNPEFATQDNFNRAFKELLEGGELFDGNSSSATKLLVDFPRFATDEQIMEVYDLCDNDDKKLLQKAFNISISINRCKADGGCKDTSGLKFYADFYAYVGWNDISGLNITENSQEYYVLKNFLQYLKIDIYSDYSKALKIQSIKACEECPTLYIVKYSLAGSQAGFVDFTLLIGVDDGSFVSNYLNKLDNKILNRVIENLSSSGIKYNPEFLDRNKLWHRGIGETIDGILTLERMMYYGTADNRLCSMFIYSGYVE